MENTVKIVGIKKMLKKDTKDQYYFNLYYTQPFPSMMWITLLIYPVYALVQNLPVKIMGYM